MNKLYRVLRAIVRPICLLIFRIKYIGLENLPDGGGYIICSNHTSMMDIPIIAIKVKPQVHYMAKEELFKNKISAWFFNQMGAFAVKRGSGGVAALKQAEELVKSGNVMGIFPEGTRNFEGAPKKAKSGISVVVANSNATVVPVSIYHEGKLKLFDKITVRFGEPISKEQLGMTDSSRTELRRVSTLLMDKITEQWEKGH